MALWLSGVIGHGSVRAVFDIASADRQASKLARAFGIAPDPKRTWEATPGGTAGRGETTRWSFATDRTRLLGFSDSAPSPYGTGDVGDAALSEAADRITKALFPEFSKWRVLSETSAAGDGGEPPRFTRNVASADAVCPVRKFLIELESSSGRPILIMVAYKEPKIARGSIAGETVLTITLDRTIVPPP